MKTLAIVVSATLLAWPIAATAQVKVLMSGGFSGAYEQLLPEFERTSGIKVATGSGASQGSGPQTIGAQLASGVAGPCLRSVRLQQGRTGVDGQDFADIEAYGVQRWLGELAFALRPLTDRTPSEECTYRRPNLLNCPFARRPDWSTRLHLDEYDLDFLDRSIESVEGNQVNRRTKKTNVLGVEVEAR
jgi:hypothetical protein